MTLNNGEKRATLRCHFHSRDPLLFTHHLFPSGISLKRPGTSLGQASWPSNYLQCALYAKLPEPSEPVFLFCKPPPEDLSNVGITP